MLIKSSFVALLLAILVFYLELEAANITAVISKSPSPSYAVEGRNFTLEWTYTLDGTVGSTKFSIVTDDGSELLIGKKFGPGVITFEPNYEARFRAQATDTRAELTISAVKTSDEQTYKLDVLPVGEGAISARVSLTVNSSSRITEITGKTVIEGGNVTLYCSVEGKPIPSITWTRLSDSRIVTMPLINISRRDVRDYRCTAENGVGAPATRNITIDVQFAPESASLSTNLSTVPLVCFGMVVNFTCTVEASNPAVVTFTLYENGLMISNKVDSGVWSKILDAGGKVTYECQANNSVGTSSSNKTVVSVEVSASATVESNNIVVREGKDVDLVCNGSGIPSPRIFWLNVSNVIMENGRIWSLHNISRTMTGQYTCIARNSCGNDSQKVDVVVLYPTEATGPGENATEAVGGVKMFSCPVTGNPEPNITWYSEETGRTISSGRQLEAEKSGCYTCVARNTVGPAVSITQCLIIIPPSTMSPEAFFTSVPPSTMPPGGAVEGKVMIAKKYSDDYQNLDSGPSKEFVAWFLGEMDKIYMNLPEYYWTRVLNLRPGSVIVNFILHFKTDVTREKGLENLRAAISSNGTFGGIEAEYLSNESTTSTTPASPKPAVSVLAGPPWAIIGAVAGGIVLLAISVGVLIWWVYKERKCRKDTKIPNPDLGRQEEEGGYSLVQGAYAQSGPPAANGTDGAAAEQQLEGATAIPTYAAVDKSKKKKKLREVPPVYAEVDKSKKKKKKIDDKDLYETLDEPKKAKIPGELLYADLGDFQNRAVSTVSISPQPLPAIKKPEAYERTDYADIAQFLKGNTTSPQNGGNEDTEWKPERPSKKKIQGKDNETQI